MRDPHIVFLHYRLQTAPGTMFANPVPVERETDAFRLCLADAALVVEMKEHYASEQDARCCVERYLHTWEIDAALRWGRGTIMFVFERAEVIERDPPPADPGGALAAAAYSTVKLTDHVALKVVRPQYPEPPATFVATPDVETMWFRYQLYLDGREPLLSMAYACLTLLESTAGSQGARTKAARKYNIAQKVLNKLADLSSTRGDRMEARKFKAGVTRRSLEDTERRWIEEVIKALIQRLGQQAADPQVRLPTLVMNDLP